jgi:ubiquinone/menaquinone biosynthesis C-methylase UbiE
MMTTDATFWDGIADRYAKRPLPNPDSTRRKLDIVRSRLQPDHVVVDVGCGTGTIALELARVARDVHGIDISGEMVRIARDKARAQSADNVAFHQGGALEGLAPLHAASIDVVCAFNILHLVPDRRAVLERIFALLRPGGTFVSSTPCLGGTLVPYRSLIAVMRWFGKAPPVACFDEGTLTAAVDDAGFVDLERPDVGAGKLVAFVVARKPAA